MSPIRFAALALTIFAASAALAAQAQPGSVELTRRPATVQTKLFDPKHLPDPPPPLEPQEAACCVWDFHTELEIEYATTQGGPLAGVGPNRAKITKVRATLDQAIVIWLPKGGAADLKAHEEGHHVIAQRAYDSSEDAVRQLLASYIGKTLTAPAGEDLDAAVNAAIQELSKACNDTMGRQAGRVSAIYDELTDHNRKKDPPPSKAIDMAFERYRKELR